MKQVLVKFGSCCRCPFRGGKYESVKTKNSSGFNYFPFCKKKRRILYNIVKIPTWCPLEDVI